ncbi:MAG: hypothetical protein ABR973_03790 [Candidatus Acidiferrales bacterium]|jgi:hypothetical protein
MKQLKWKNSYTARIVIETGDDGDRFFALQRPNGKFEMNGNHELVLSVSPTEAERSGVVDSYRGKGKFRIVKCIIATPQG